MLLPPRPVVNVPSITVQGVEILIDDVKKENKDLKVDILVWAVETAGIDDCGVSYAFDQHVPAHAHLER